MSSPVLDDMKGSEDTTPEVEEAQAVETAEAQDVETAELGQIESGDSEDSEDSDDRSCSRDSTYRERSRARSVTSSSGSYLSPTNAAIALRSPPSRVRSQRSRSPCNNRDRSRSRDYQSRETSTSNQRRPFPQENRRRSLIVKVCRFYRFLVRYGFMLMVAMSLFIIGWTEPWYFPVIIFIFFYAWLFFTVGHSQIFFTSSGPCKEHVGSGVASQESFQRRGSGITKVRGPHG
jgi:hypothetical protein